MLNHSRWAAMFLVVGGLFTAYLARQQSTRQRRQGKVAARGTAAVTTNLETRPSTTIASAAEDAAALVEAPSASSQASARRRILVSAASLALLLGVLGGLAQHDRGAAEAPAVAVEAVDTGDGVRLAVRGQHFRPGADVTLAWNDGSEAAKASVLPDGTLLAVVDMPDGREAARELTVDDGERVARQVYAVGAESHGGVLGVGAGTKVSVEGGSYFLLGANYPWVHYGNDFGSNNWGSYGVHSGGSYEADFADMASKGVHVARWWVFADGRAGINFAADGTPTGIQPVVYQDVNTALALARKYNIYLTLVLFDVSLLSKGNTVGGVKMGGHTDAISDARKRTALVNNVVKPLAQAYGSEEMILAWEIMNEPEWGISDLPHPAVNPDFVPVTMSQFWSFASSASQMIHFYAQDQVTIGSAALKWHRVWMDAFAQSRGLPALNLDFYQTHYYQWMDCCRTDDPVLGNTSWSPLAQPAFELGLDKPIVVGEIHTPAGEADVQLDRILANGYAGFFGWSYKYERTGDKMQIDWAGFQEWERAHADIVRIPPPGQPGPAPTATATPRPPTSTPTKVATNTATRTPTKAATNTATRTPTKTATSAPKTATNTSTPVKTSAPSPTPTPVNVPSGTVHFDDLGMQNTLLSGQYPAGAINWGSGDWYLSSPWGDFTTKSISLSSTRNWARFSFVDGSGRLLSLQAFNGGPNPSTIRLECGANVPKEVIVPPGEITNISTGWTLDCTAVTLRSSNGWHTNFDNLVYADEGAIVVDEPTVEPTVSVPDGTNITPIATSTSSATSTPTSTSMPPTPTPTPVAQPTPTPGGPLPACSGDCGTPRDFCDTWQGGFCTDYRHLGPTTFEVPFPPPGEKTSLDCLDATDPNYQPQMLGGTLPFPCGFSKFEHFMTRMESGSFGIVQMRFHQPMTVPTTGERHIHFDIDLKGRARNYTRLMLSPNLTKRASDDRGGDDLATLTFLDVWFYNGNVLGTICHNGSCVGDSYPYGDAFGSDWPPYIGQDNVRDHVDIYVSRSRIRVLTNGVERVNDPISLAFDTAYLYLTQVSYNPCKDGYCAPADSIMHWDNVAFDGPVLPVNGLTPRESRDVVFNAYSATSCSVKGVPATPMGLAQGFTWVTWVARLPDDGSAVSAADVSCNYSYVQGNSNIVRGLEIVKQP